MSQVISNPDLADSCREKERDAVSILRELCREEVLMFVGISSDLWSITLLFFTNIVTHFQFVISSVWFVSNVSRGFYIFSFRNYISQCINVTFCLKKKLHKKWLNFFQWEIFFSNTHVFVIYCPSSNLLLKKQPLLLKSILCFHPFICNLDYSHSLYWDENNDHCLLSLCQMEQVTPNVKLRKQQRNECAGPKICNIEINLEKPKINCHSRKYPSCTFCSLYVWHFH